MSFLERLLVLQSHDTHLEQIRHRRENLPERSDLRSIHEGAAKLDARHEQAAAIRLERTKVQKRCEVEIATLQRKRDQEKRLLYSGEVTGVRELQAIEQEIAALTRRLEVVEDKLLEVLEELDPLNEEIASLEAQKTALEQREESLRGRLAEIEGELDSRTQEVQSLRWELAAGIPEDLKATYESLRSQLGGVGVARLDGSTCTGCHLFLSLMELDQLRKMPPEGESETGRRSRGFTTCPSCGRLLVI